MRRFNLKSKFITGHSAATRLITARDEKEFQQALSRYIGETEKNLILTDRNTLQFCFPVLKNAFAGDPKMSVITVEPGEKHKNVQTLEYIWKQMLELRVDRSTRLINLGGGMVSDLGGFAASTFKRGIPFVNIPTTLLGMVDAAIGGKNAINIGDIKNQAGTIELPRAIILYPSFLKTLPQQELLSGYAEMLKTSIVFDPDTMNKLTALSTGLMETGGFIDQIADHISATSQTKHRITRKDLYDAGQRQCLNFGHSMGHAFEALYNRKGLPLPHGHAIAAGMLCEAFLSVHILGMKKEDQIHIESHIKHFFDPLELDARDIEQIIELLKYDKKSSGRQIRMSLLRSIGHCQPGTVCPEDMIRQSLIAYLS